MSARQNVPRGFDDRDRMSVLRVKASGGEFAPVFARSALQAQIERAAVANALKVRARRPGNRSRVQNGNATGGDRRRTPSAQVAKGVDETRRDEPTTHLQERTGATSRPINPSAPPGACAQQKRLNPAIRPTPTSTAAGPEPAVRRRRGPPTPGRTRQMVLAETPCGTADGARLDDRHRGRAHSGRPDRRRG